jgi:5-methylcytosine-specific restriction endonuclease McrA
VPETHVQRQRRLRKIGRKHCLRCDTEKELNEFYRRPDRPTGHVPLCKSCILARSKKYRDERLEHYRQLNRQWYAAHPGYKTAWAKANRDRHLEHRATRRFRERSQWVEAVDRAEVYRRAAGLCGVCSEPVGYLEFHLDHIVPLARGGTHEYANVQPAHEICNKRKAAA